MTHLLIKRSKMSYGPGLVSRGLVLRSSGATW
jgi:hypothetical protein